MELSNLKGFSLSSVVLTDKYLVNAYEKEVSYLLSLNPDKLLAGFRETAGLDMKGFTRYDGWENSLIGGHTIGHYMTACVQAYETGNATKEQKEKLLGILEELTEGLKECQNAVGTGYIFGAVLKDRDNIELQFDNVERNKGDIMNEAWVPWYTMHKIFEGLVSAAQLEGDSAREKQVAATALEVVSRLADWTYGRTSAWSGIVRNTVLGIEYGGMNDCLYDVYLLTGKEEHLLAAKAFDEVELFEKVLKAMPGDDVLNNVHANTTIPKFMGALKRYTVTKEPEFLAYAEAFWTLVVNNHTYITGGNSEWEHFGRDGILDAERTNANCETCNAYNMLKMTELLYKLGGDVKYADWYENTFTNSILSSQNPETGMTTYFQSMATGYFKVYSGQTNKFWCCTGTGMENFSKLGGSFYYWTEDCVIVNQYYSSVLKSDRISITQVSNLPERDEVVFTFNADYKGKILFRLPDWLAAEAHIKVDGINCCYSIIGADAEAGRNGYAVIDGTFSMDAVISLVLPMKVKAFGLQDSEGTFAFKYGPVVLSACLGSKDMTVTSTGVDVTIPEKKDLSLLTDENERITVNEGSVEDFIENIDSHLVRDEDADKLTFVLTGTDTELRYAVHFRQHTERYGLYFEFVEVGSRDEEPVEEEASDVEISEAEVSEAEVSEIEDLETEASEVESSETETSETEVSKAETLEAEAEPAPEASCEHNIYSRSMENADESEAEPASAGISKLVKAGVIVGATAVAGMIIAIINRRRK